MFVKLWNTRFRTLMWSDSRLVDKQGYFCLCTKCLRENEKKGIECPTHKAFMRMTRILNIASPVFACLNFIDDPDVSNLTDELYPKEKVESAKEEERYRVLKEYINAP